MRRTLVLWSLSLSLYLIVLVLQLSARAQAQFWDDIGPATGDTGAPFQIPYQTPSTFTIPGTTKILTGQYTLGKYMGVDGNQWSAYVEFQNQAHGTVFNPICNAWLFGDPLPGNGKECYTQNYMAASQISAYTDTKHLTTPYTQYFTGGNVPGWHGELQAGQTSGPTWPTSGASGSANTVWVVRIGANGQYKYTRASGTIPCSTDYLGTPLPGQTMTCSVMYNPSYPYGDSFLSTSSVDQYGNMPSATVVNGSPAGTWVFCAQENNICAYFNAMQTPTYLRYGRVTGEPNTGTIIRLMDTGGKFSCSNTAFYTDPAPGYQKSCWYFQPNVRVSLSTGSWLSVAGGGTYGVQWGQTSTYTTQNTTQFSSSLALAVSEAWKMSVEIFGAGGESTTTFTETNTDTWTSSTAWTQATSVSASTQCSSTPGCTGHLYQWSVTANPQQNTIGGMTVPGTITACMFACVPDNAVPICMPGSCPLTCPLSPLVASDECCYCLNGSSTSCDFSVCSQ